MNIILFDEECSFVKSSSYAFSHIINVLKLKENDEFKLGFVNKSKGRAKILSIDDDKINFCYKKEKEDSKFLNLYLSLAYIRPICAKRVVRAAGEIGLKGVIFFSTLLNEKSYKESNFYKKKEAIEYLKEGASISGDYLVPELVLLDNLKDLINFSKERNIKNKYLLQIGENFEKLSKENNDLSMLTIGPERGWTKEEIFLLENHDFKKRKLGSRILRSEEACIMSLFPFL